MSLGFHGFMKTSKKFVDYLDFLAYYFIGIFYIKHRKKSHTLEKINLSWCVLIVSLKPEKHQNRNGQNRIEADRNGQKQK